MSQMNIIIDVDKCTGCRLCEAICSVNKEGESNPLKSRIQVEEYIMEGMRVPRICINCADPLCIPACPTEALTKDEVTGWTMLNDDECTQCGACTAVCLTGALSIKRPEMSVSFDQKKCSICELCVPTCPTRAMFVRPTSESFFE